MSRSAPDVDRDALADRVRAALAGAPAGTPAGSRASGRAGDPAEDLADARMLVEKSMFGGRAFMLDGAMVCCAQRGGDLLVRVDGSRSGELLARPGATQAEMGAGRTMGPSWISVDASALEDDADVGFWVGVALERHRAARSAPASPTRRRRARPA